MFLWMLLLDNFTMKTFKDDFSGRDYPTEQLVSVDITFRSPADRKLYKATLDISPESAMRHIIGNCIIKPFPFNELKKLSDEEKAKLGVKTSWTQVPAPTAKNILASMVEIETGPAQ